MWPSSPYRIQPHSINATLVFVLGQLYTPFTSTFISIVFPSGDDPFLYDLMRKLEREIRELRTLNR